MAPDLGKPAHELTGAGWYCNLCELGMFWVYFLDGSFKFQFSDGTHSADEVGGGRYWGPFKDIGGTSGN